MARCTVTVEGKAFETEADSLYRAVFEYNAAAVSYPGLELPKLQMDTPIEVRSRAGTFTTTLRKAMSWANRQTAKPVT